MEIEQRLNRLEQSVRKWKAITAGLVLMLAVGVTIAATDDPKERILDCAGVKVWQDGKITTRIGYGDGGAGELTTYAANGTKLVDISATPGGFGGGLTIHSAKGNELVFIGSTPYDTGDGMLATYSAQGKELVYIGAMTGGGAMATRSYKGRYLVDIRAMTEGGRLTIHSTEGAELVDLGSAAGSGHGYVSVKAADHRTGVWMVGRTPDGTGGYLHIINKTGETAVELHADEYGNGVVGAFNRKGKGRTLKPGP
jgi:hypothetical protein